MSRIEISVSGRSLFATGDIRPWVDIDLLLRDNAGKLVPETFRVDTGTDITTYPAYHAKSLGLPYPAAPSRIAHQQTRLEVRSGILRVRIAAMASTEYVTTCFFLGDPDLPPTGPPASLPRKLLQPLGLLDRLRFTMDRDPSAGALHGQLIVEKK